MNAQPRDLPLQWVGHLTQEYQCLTSSVNETWDNFEELFAQGLLLEWWLSHQDSPLTAQKNVL